MDGVSIIVNNAKQTFNCPNPQAWLADIGIISTACSEITTLGYADFCTKITAGADWILANNLNVEPINETAWAIVEGE